MTPVEYVSLLCETLLNFQRDGTLCDVVIKARNGAVHAHSAVLAASNVHLRQTLKDQYETTSSDTHGRIVYHFDLNNCSLAAIISVLQSVYSGKDCSTVDPECQRTMKRMGFLSSQESSESKITLINSSYHLSQSLLELQHDGILCDVTINAGNGSINAHSAILAAANPVIRSLFEKQAADECNNSGRLHYHIDLHDFSLDSIVTSLHSMYVGGVDGVGTLEEKERFLKLTALGFGIPHAGVADTTTGQSSADVLVQCSTTSKSHNVVLRKRYQETNDACASKLIRIDPYNAAGQPNERVKSDVLKSEENIETSETSQVTSSDEAVSAVNADDEIREEVYEVIQYESLDEVNSTERSYYVCAPDATESNVEPSNYVLLDSGHEPQDCISDDLYIGCATEETVEIKEQEEEQTPVTFANPIVHTGRPKSESILIIPSNVTRKRRDNEAEQFGYSNFQSASHNIQSSGSKRSRPAAVTVIDFQQVKAAENLNKALRADQNKIFSKAEMSVMTAPAKRYFLASKPNSVISLQQSQQSKPSSYTNQVSILLPADRLQPSRERDQSRNGTSANLQTQSAIFNHRQNESEISSHTLGKFRPIRSNNMNFPNSVTDRRSLLLPICNQIKNADGPCVSNSNDAKVTAKKQIDASTAVLRITPKVKRGVSLDEELKYTKSRESHQEDVEIESKIKENCGLDKDGINEVEREGNNDSEHRRSCRKRKMTVPVKKIHAARCEVEVEGDLTITNNVTYDPPCTEEVEVSTSTDISYVPNSREYSSEVNIPSAESCQLFRSIGYSEEQNAQDEEKCIVIQPDITVKEISRSNNSTSIQLNDNEVVYVISSVGSDGLKETVSGQSLNDEYLLNLNVKKSEDIDNTEEVQYSISKDIEQVNSGEYCQNEIHEEAPLDEQTEEEVVEAVEAEINNTTCKYCEKNFDWPDELSEHMTLCHRCIECSHEFKQTSNLRKHVRIHHNHERSHECPVCLKGFSFRSALKDHIRIHEDAEDNKPMYSCDKCAKVFTRISGLRRHKKVDHSDVLEYECTKCDKRYAYQCNLNNHMMTHSALKPFTCETCGLGFKQNSNLLKHMRTQHNKCSKCTGQCTCIARPAYECNTCGKTCGGRTQLRVHQRVHSGEKPEVCDLCGTAFQHKSNLMKHRIKHGGTKPYVCSFCMRGFYSNHSLQSHMRLHTGESPHQCDVCGKRFCTRNGLQVHSVLHGDQREFVCGTCGKAFAQLGNLNKHLAIHTGARPFPCNQCTMAFVDSSALRRHIVLHTRERNFACPTCGRTFMYLTSLRAHKLTHEEMKSHVCKICCKAFRQKAGYLRHLKIHNESRDNEEVVLKPGEYIVYLTE